MRPPTLSRAQARRTALVAQGFRDPRPAEATMRTFTRTMARTGLLQIDSVNVLARAHHMPLFSRMGPYDTDLLRRASEVPPRRVVEYWAHVAAFMPVDLWPVMRHRMARYREQGHAWVGLPQRRALVTSLLAEITERGAATAADLDARLAGPPTQRAGWGWNWSEAKKALEYLFLAGELAVAGRTSQFERLYDLPERVVPAAQLEAPTPSPQEAARELVRRAAVAHGVGTAACFADYFRMRVDRGDSVLARPAVDELVESGELLPVRIEGWDRPAYLHRDAVLPRRVRARALLSPFDPVVWERSRTEHLFGLRYRLEIYVPEALRVHGYYVLPFLLGDRIVARVDLKADRRGSVLRVLAAHLEPSGPEETAVELAAELRVLAGWLRLDAVDVSPRGDLAGALAAAVRAG